MNFPDPKWLEILKASGWQTAALSLACGIFLLAGHTGLLPPLASWMVQLAAFCFLVFGLLAVASLITAFLKFFPVQTWIVHWINVRRAKLGLQKYIPYMTTKELAIIGYLLAKNQKTFTAAVDGGHAATLLSRGIVITLARGGQHLDPENIPMTIPDPLWDVLVLQKDKFPYSPPPRGETEAHPWRVSWMAR